jgi:RNA polymerase sigma factor (TIGR02999 family)
MEVAGMTQLLIRWGDGDPAALHQLTPMVYDELRRLARSFLRRQAPQHSLQPTAIVHEAWIKLLDHTHLTWQNRAQFFGLAAKVMRDLLVDHARQRRAAKRGGGEPNLSLIEAENVAGRPAREIDLLALDEALQRLAQINARRSRTVELRFFGGLNNQETAVVLGVSEGTVERDWTLARAWLYKALQQ